MNEKQFETKFTTAVIGFAMQLQSLMDNANEEIAEKIVKKYKENPDISIEELTKEFAGHIANKLIKEFDLKVNGNETKP